MTTHDENDPQDSNGSENGSDRSSGSRTDQGSDRGRSSEYRAGSCGGRRSRRHHHGRRKERVLHTRISEQLSQDIRELADDLRVPVSNLVRNVLEEVFTVVENVTDDVGDFFEDVVDEADGIRERIRNQQAEQARSARSDSRNPRSRRRHSRRGRRDRSPIDVEQEFQRGEAEEARDSGSGEGAATAPPGEESVLGWQPIVLNTAITCPRCDTTLDPGVNAMMAILQAGGTGKVVCPSCAAKN